jgi:hypothetical protein
VEQLVAEVDNQSATLVISDAEMTSFAATDGRTKERPASALGFRQCGRITEYKKAVEARVGDDQSALIGG